MRRGVLQGLTTLVALAGLLAVAVVGPPPAVAANGAPRGGLAGSAWSLPIDATYFGVHDDEVLRVKPSQWGTGRMHAAWCTVAPSSTADVHATADQTLATTFRVNAKNDVRRLNVSLGHPAPWVFGDHPTAVRTSVELIWYCQHALANTSFPTRKSLIVGPVHDAYDSYIRAVIAAAGDYLGADPANRLVLQTWNEPNLGNGGQVTRRIPGAARTWKQAAASLQEQERIIRAVADELIPGRFEISSPALYGKSNALTRAYLAAQARDRTVDSISLNFYTHTRRPGVTMARWTTKAAAAIGLVRAYRSLRTVPVWITETNHNLVNNQPGNRSNMQGLWASAAVQRHLVEATTAQALRLGFAGLEWYQGSLQQVAVNTRAGTIGALAAQEFLAQVAGRTVQKCGSRRTVITCTLVSPDPTVPPLRMRWSTKGFDGVTFLPPVVASPDPYATTPAAA